MLADARAITTSARTSAAGVRLPVCPARRCVAGIETERLLVSEPIGTVDSMKTTVDRAGRLVIPKEIRDAVGLRPGMTLDARCIDGRITIEPEPLPVRLVECDGLLVMEALAPVEPLTSEMVEGTRDLLQRERVSLWSQPCRPVL